ncbi:helix-turn-helix domain-containing protein [Flavobacterium zepuense]|uniref:Helix-turn-helix domain-containing protein n=1 Tax=Flavobacterium zepuense TaxID=2593302 RepID=A0A552VB19_9FLAO|nr:AraC family transcriptional regulator [Flavobacterium zepuense]TRW27560.1 helix-turn-helix domain-containing protein [Flavobacterium zepuense]
MIRNTLDSKEINTLRDLPDMIPVFREFFEDWTIRVFNRQQHECRNYLSPNRREFYKILLITKGAGVFTMGLNTYYVEEPTLLFIHPNDIISWKNLSEESGGYYVLFKKSFVSHHLQLKAIIDKFALFSDKAKSVIRLTEDEVPRITQYFEKMQAEEQDTDNADYKEDAMQAFLQLLMVESMKVARYPKPDEVTEDFSHIHHFFNLLERETSGINYETPIRIKTAKEFASDLQMHPNYLNALLKKHTGQNASTHIRNRILDEAKALLVQTDWSLQDISYSIGFAEQPNFNFFFKKNTGITPAEFRKSF